MTGLPSEKFYTQMEGDVMFLCRLETQIVNRKLPTAQVPAEPADRLERPPARPPCDILTVWDRNRNIVCSGWSSR